MLTNFHTHTTFCDGIGTPEEVVLAAINEGFDAIGFSGHGNTPYDLRYCMKDTDGYIREISRLKEKYSGKIEIYLGVEEDSRSEQDRARFDYVIGSCHYASKNGLTVPIDSNKDYFLKALELFEWDDMAFAEHYYSNFTEYIKRRKPDVIGHFDLVTKFDETLKMRYLDNNAYITLAEKYTLEALKSGSLFEVNTGLITRGYRTAPCPAKNLLRIILKNGGGVVLSSDSHAPDTLSAHFDLAKAILKDVGFKKAYTLKSGKWVTYEI